eukprot:359793-Chlamydomonas_euryale.AAC.17
MHTTIGPWQMRSIWCNGSVVQDLWEQAVEAIELRRQIDIVEVMSKTATHMTQANAWENQHQGSIDLFTAVCTLGRCMATLQAATFMLTHLFCLAHTCCSVAVSAADS